MSWKNLPYWLKGSTIGLIIGLGGFIPIFGPIVYLPTVALFGLYGGDYISDIDVVYGIIFWVILCTAIGILLGKIKSK